MEWLGHLIQFAILEVPLFHQKVTSSTFQFVVSFKVEKLKSSL
ncbi:hypothetical protein V6Z11_A07G225600 [Gossypium hirsutum]